MLKKLMTIAGVAGTLGAAAPAFADWYQPAPPPAYGMPVQRPPYAGGGFVADGDDWRSRQWRGGDEWRGDGEWRNEEWRENDWRRHEAWERYRRWRRWQWTRHHYQNW